MFTCSPAGRAGKRTFQVPYSLGCPLVLPAHSGSSCPFFPSAGLLSQSWQAQGSASCLLPAPNIAPSWAYLAIKRVWAEAKGPYTPARHQWGRNCGGMDEVSQRSRCNLALWPPSIFLSFKPPHSLSQGLTENLHPKQDYPAWLEETTVLHPRPPHHNSSLQTQLQPSWVRKSLFIPGDKQKIAWLLPEQSWDFIVC